MSLPVLAQHMASKGRNGDTMLVHMTPGEVHGLHALALAHGGKLTINPDTGLPEANFLKKLLPMIAGAALNFFAPGIGTAIGGALGGLSGAAGTAIAVGGITGLATGSLQKGLMAGLGAYGGAGLTDALLGGAGAAGAAGALGVEGAATGAGSQAAMLAEQTAGFGGEGLKSLADSAAYAKGATPSLTAAFKAGAEAAAKNPGAFLKDAAKPLMYAAAPIMADQAVPTVTKSPGETGYIRPFVFDPATFGQGPQGLQALAPIPANQISYGPPPGGANGGLVALARGGSPSIPEVGSPERAAWEQRLVEQLGPEAAAQARTNPNSVLSPTFSADLAANLAGQAELQRRGEPSVFGKGTFRDYYQTYYGREATPEDVAKYNASLMVEKPMGGSITQNNDLNSLLNEYMTSALAGNASRAAGAFARMGTLGLSGSSIREMTETISPGFDSKIYDLYYKPQEGVTTSRAPVYELNSFFESGSGGWPAAAAAIKAGRISIEDVAYGLGLSANEVKQRIGMSPPPVPAPTSESQPPATDYITGGVGALPQAPGQGAVAPAATVAAPAAPETTGIGALIPGTTAGTATTPGRVIPGTVMGGGVTTPTTATTPTFMLPPGEQIFRTPVGTITGGTVTGAVDTKEALREYERTAPTGRPPEVTALSVLQGYKGTDKTYGGVEKPYAFPAQAQLGTAGSISRGTETMEDVRKAVGDRYAMTASRFEPIVSGASKSAYDYLVGRGEYPTDQRREVDVGPALPLWRPYVQGAAGAAPTGYVPATGAPAAQFGFKPVTGTTLITGTQRWKNTKTGEIYLAPSGYAPPSNDWVLVTTDTNTEDLSGTGPGGSGLGGGGEGEGGDGDGFGGGESAKAGGLMRLAMGGYAQGGYNLGSYSDGGRLLRGPGDGVSDSIPATIGAGQPARLADGEFVVPARIVSELGNGSTEAGARKLYAMMDRVQRARRKTTGKNKVAANTKAERFLPA